MSGPAASKGRGFCVWCLSALTEDADHEGCRQDRRRAKWTLCLLCLGGGFTANGRDCPSCDGVGFREIRRAARA